MKQFLFLVLVVLLAIPGKAQLVNVQGADNKTLRETEFLDVKGSPYLSENFYPGSAVDGTGRPYPNLSVRYNSYKDVMEAKENDLLIALDSRLYKQFTIRVPDNDKETLTTRNFSNGFTDIPGTTRLSYFEIVTDGNYKLLKRIKTDLMEENVSNYGTGGVVKRFSTQDTYYLYTPDSKGIVIGKLNKKNFLTAIGSKQSDVETFLEKEKIKLKSEKSYEPVMAYLNSLQ